MPTSDASLEIPRRFRNNNLFNDEQCHQKLKHSYNFDKNKDQKTNFCQ